MNGFRSVFQNTVLWKVLSLNGIALLFRLGTGLILNKIIAIYLGTSGIALLGNFRNFVTSLQYVATGGMSNGIVKYAAEYHKSPEKLSGLLSSSLVVIAVLNICIGLGLLLFSSFWQQYIFDSFTIPYYKTLFWILTGTIPVFSLTSVFVSLWNGLSFHTRFIVTHLIANILGFGLQVFLISQFDLEGGLLGISILPVFVFIPFLIYAFRDQIRRLPSLALSTRSVDVSVIKDLGSFAVMTFASGWVLPQVLIWIRSELIAEVGISYAGYWEAIQQVSRSYMAFVTSIILLYLFPKLVQATSNYRFQMTVFSFLKFMLPLALLGMLILYFSRFWVVRILFTDTFLPMTELFVWQLAGDFVKITAISIAYQFLAKKMFWPFLISEFISVFSILGFSLFFIQLYGYTGAVIGHFVGYVWYLCLVLFMLRKVLFSKNRIYLS